MRAIFLLVVAMVVSGCQLLANSTSACLRCDNGTAVTQEGGETAVSGGNYLPASALDYRRPSKPLSDYAADLALQLMQSMHYTAPDQAVAITSFVVFDQQLSNTTAVGNQLAEHMYFQLQRLGVKVADIKLARQVRVTPEGDLALSRGAYLDAQQQISYVLTGTLLRDSAGVVVNARIMHLQQKAILASAQIHIPNFVLAAPTGIELSVISSL